MRFLLHNETKDETGWCMLDDLEAAEGWAELTYEEQTERIRAAFDAQFERDKAKDTRQEGKKSKKPMCKHGDCKSWCLGRADIRGGVRVVDEHGKLVCPMYRCRNHGGRSTGGSEVGKDARTCKHPGCSKQGQHDGDRSIENPIGDKSIWWRYCSVPHKDADAPRRQLFEDIRKKLGPDDPTVQAKLTDLNAKHKKKDDNMPFDTALAQLKNILAAGTLQALQDALDAGPSGAGGA